MIEECGLGTRLSELHTRVRAAGILDEISAELKILDIYGTCGQIAWALEFLHMGSSEICGEQH